MKTCRVGILGTANIASRRFLPALMLWENMEYVGVASRTKEMAEVFVSSNGGKPYVGYQSMLEDMSIDAVYLPLPPSLHYEWTKAALLNGKHVIVEKPIVSCKKQLEELFEIANKNNLVIHENYMFVYHKQIEYIVNLVQNSEVGKIRLIQCKFGFPHRKKGDFRYEKALGGGSLVDCGGYTVKLASKLLGNELTVFDAYLNYENEEVDLYGSAVLRNQDGVTAQLAFGMDNDYKCELEIWGSEGVIKAPRVFTASAIDIAKVIVCKNGEEKMQYTFLDDHFKKSIQYFNRCLESELVREENLKEIKKQVSIIADIKHKALTSV